MTRNLQLVDKTANGDTYGSTLDKINNLINLFSTSVVTVSANSDNSVGNGFVVGTFGALNLIANTLSGSNGNLNVIGNTQFYANMVANQVTITKLLAGTTLNINSSIISIGNSTVNSSVNTTSLFTTGNVISGAFAIANTMVINSSGISFTNTALTPVLPAALSGYQTANGLASNVATLTANNTSFVGSIAAGNVVSAATLAANLAGYQTTGGLAANVATLTANAANYIGSIAANNIISNTTFLNTRTALKVSGNTIGTRSFLNLIAGAGTSLSASDNANNNTVDVTISISTNGISATLTSSSNVTTGTQSLVDQFNANTYRSAQYLITLSDNNIANYQVTNLLLIQDGADVFMTEYGTMFTAADLGEFSSNLNSGVISLYYTPTSNNVTAKITKTVVAV